MFQFKTAMNFKLFIDGFDVAFDSLAANRKNGGDLVYVCRRNKKKSNFGLRSGKADEKGGVLNVWVNMG